MAPLALGGVSLSGDCGSLIPEPSLPVWRSDSALHGEDEAEQEVEVEVKSQPRCVPQCPQDAILHAYPGNQESFSVGCNLSQYWKFIILLCFLYT
jgi:hypothetical protein